MDLYFGCEYCTKLSKTHINDILTYDISEVSVNDYSTQKKDKVFKNAEYDEILEYINQTFKKSQHLCDGINHINVAYNNDGPFFSVNGKHLYSVLLDPENDTFRDI